MRLSASRYPAIIISASGMATGGRVLHHLKAAAPDERNAVVFAGLPGRRQPRRAPGGRRTRGQDPWRDGAGARRGAAPAGLLGPRRPRRTAGLAAPPEARRRSQTFVVHGEPDAADTLRVAIQNELGWAVRVPEFGEQCRALTVKPAPALHGTASTTLPTARPCSTSSCACAICASGRRCAIACCSAPCSSRRVRTRTACSRSVSFRL